MKFLPLVFRNVMRNRRRAWLTILSLAVPFFLLMTLQTALESMEIWRRRADNNLRVIVFHKMGLVFDLPESHARKVARIPGVVDVCAFTWYGGVYRSFKDGMIASMGVDPDAFRKVWPDGSVPADQYEEFRKDRTAAAIDQRLARKFGWKVGDKVALKGTVRPVDLEFRVKAIITDSVDPNGFYVHRAYLDEALGRPGILTDVWMTVDRMENVPKVIRAAEEMFANSTFEVKVDVEKNFVNAIMGMWGNIQGLVGTIGSIVVAIIMLVAANSIAMSVRERTSEVAVMKAIGFSPGFILALILGESAFLGLAAGFIGCSAGYILFSVPQVTAVFGIWAALFSAPGKAAFTWLWLAPITGMVAGFVPAFSAARLRVVDALRQVA